jgi:hypothetical protein
VTTRSGAAPIRGTRTTRTRAWRRTSSRRRWTPPRSPSSGPPSRPTGSSGPRVACSRRRHGRSSIGCRATRRTSSSTSTRSSSRRAAGAMRCASRCARPPCRRRGARWTSPSRGRRVPETFSKDLTFPAGIYAATLPLPSTSGKSGQRSLVSAAGLRPNTASSGVVRSITTSTARDLQLRPPGERQSAHEHACDHKPQRIAAR